MQIDENSIRVATKAHENALLNPEEGIDIITPDEAKSLYGLFRQRVERTPDSPAYGQFDDNGENWRTYTWKEVDEQVQKWRKRLAAEDIQEGDRVAILLKNSVHWIVFDIACQSAGIINVPLYVEDRPDNMAYIIVETECKILFIDTAEHWSDLRSRKTIRTNNLNRIIVSRPFKQCDDERVISTDDWLAQTDENTELEMTEVVDRMEQTASIVFTSGTTGRPKGVMLSHGNFLYNAYGSMQKLPVRIGQRLLSFLPLSHTFERTLGYYAPLMGGACVFYSRSIPQLSEDMVTLNPDVLIAVPRIFERVCNKIHCQLDESKVKKKLFEMTTEIGWAKFLHEQGRGPKKTSFMLWPLLDKLVASKIREKFGKNLEFVICGGAPLSTSVAKTFIGLGINIVQGYGLTEASPVLTGNTVKDNVPESIGLPLINVELRLNSNNELLARGPNVMQGYWRNEKATEDTFCEKGEWLKTGDIANISETGHIYIVGRVKEIVVLSNGEKVPPADIESAIMEDPLFEQCMVIGEGKPFLSLISVLEPDQWKKLADQLGVDAGDEAMLNNEKVHEAVLEKIKPLLNNFPGYAQVYKVYLTLKSWTIEDDLITPTLKLKRPKLRELFDGPIEEMYKGH